MSFLIAFIFCGSAAFAQATPKFDLSKDLMLVHYDCKTDVDDLHAAAAFATLLNIAPYSTINYHAVAGTYGMQNGKYVPPNTLFELAFGKHWSDAHANYSKSLQEVSALAQNTLAKNGTIWIAEAGQSDFSADLVKTLFDITPQLRKEQIHVVQHSNWNEEVTTPEKLAFVQSRTTYHKIPDGNATGNGTPGFRSTEVVSWEKAISDPHLTKVWQLACALADQYNGKEQRYLNEAIAKGGLDFSDFSEVCWMLGLLQIADAPGYFNYIAKTR